jgi:hypothetical protein
MRWAAQPHGATVQRRDSIMRRQTQLRLKFEFGIVAWWAVASA